MNKVDWDSRFFELAKTFATWSKDRSLGVGAIITNSSHNILAQGYNGFPRSIRDNVDIRHERPLKYMWTEHAERNAIYNAAREGIRICHATMYVSSFPCVECSRAIIQTGIRKLVVPIPDTTDIRWGESWKISEEMLQEAGVMIIHK